MKTKRIIAVILTLMLFSVNVYGEMAVSETEGKLGDTVTVILSADEENCCVGSLTVSYDNEALELVNSEFSEAFSEASPMINPKFSENRLKMSWLGLNPVDFNDFCTLHFKIKSAKADYSELKIEECLLYDINAAQISTPVKNGGVRIEKTDQSASSGGSGGSSVGSGSSGSSSGGGAGGSGSSGGSGGLSDAGGEKLTEKESEEVSENVPEKEEETAAKNEDISNPFSDVNTGDWYYTAVMFAYENDITSGISKTEFAPNGRVTRGQFITMLCRAYDIPEMTGDNFADSGSMWYTPYLAAAKQLGVSNGVGNNKFAPEKEITREEMVTLIYNYLKSVGKASEAATDTSFADDSVISDWAKAAVSFACSSKIVSGKGNNMFDPKGTAVRAELAQIFYNILAK